MRSLRTVLIVVLVAGLVAPVGVLGHPAGQIATAGASEAADASAAGPAVASTIGTASQAPSSTSATASNNSSVSVGVGQQLSTVIAASESDVETEVETTAFELSFERGDEGDRAEAIAERAEELREAAADIREDYREATLALEAGNISRSQYAQRLAVLNARARNVVASRERLERRAENVSGLALASTGFDRTVLRQSIADIDNLTGTGPAALLERFTGQRRGEIEVRRADGLSIEVEGEAGERSREVERERDDDHAITVDQTVALETARSVLSEQDDGWLLERASVHPESGYYRFRFALSADEETGEAEVRVDGSTGEVFRIEEEIERRDGVPDEAGDDETEVDDVSLLVRNGTPAANATLTLLAVADGEPLSNATVREGGVRVGETGPNGTVEVTLPAGSSTFTVTAGDEDAELEFERADEDHERSDVYRDIATSANYDGGAVSLSVRYDGAGVENVTVFAAGDRVGTTDANGTVTFTTDAVDELELELVKGELEAELEYVIVDGSLVLETNIHEGDGDKIEDRDDEVDDLQLSVVDGEPSRNATITVAVLAAGDPVENATVAIDGEGVGRTDADGRLTVTLPDADEVELTAAAGGEDADLEYEFEERGDEDEERGDEDEETPEPTETSDSDGSLSLSVVAGDPAPGATITVEVTANDEPVAGATVSVEGASVGETRTDGTIDVTLPDDEDDPRVRAETDDASGRIEFDFDD